jgi:outer membrane lipoprotein-sorting protein
MKRACFSVAGALLALTIANAKQVVDPLDALLARGRASRLAIKTLSATFVETTISSLLRDPMVSTGTLVAEAPMRVVMSYKTPTAKTVALDDRRLIIVWPSPSERHELNIADTQRRVRNAFDDVTAKQLRETFTISLSSDPSLNDAYWLTMVPRRKRVSAHLERLQLWVDRTRVVLVKMKFEYPGGDSKTIELENIKTNVALDTRAFALLAAPR